jgi:hypothetical protein
MASTEALLIRAILVFLLAVPLGDSDVMLAVGTPLLALRRFSSRQSRTKKVAGMPIAVNLGHPQSTVCEGYAWESG